MEATVTSGARVHINSIDMSGIGVRACGGLGFCVDEPRMQVRVGVANGATQPLPSFMADAARRLGFTAPLQISVLSTYESHVGLGSGTQFRMCALQALYALAGQTLSPDDAFSYGIGRVSGVGVGAFFTGGLVVDGGFKCPSDAQKCIDGLEAPAKAPVVFAHRIPQRWKVLLATPQSAQSLSGSAEAAFFKSVTPVARHYVHEIAYHVLLGVMPAVLEEDFAAFKHSLSVITQLGTKPAEERLNVRYCGSLLGQLRRDFGFASVSSLGPTLFTLYEDGCDVESLRAAYPDFTFRETAIRNSPRECVIGSA